MIWYLLYPLRRTLDPPILRDDHYIRRSISHLGTIVARHSITTIIVTAVIGVSLCVPVPFLYHPASPLYYSKLPDHTWTSAESFANSENSIPDISMKQAWIYGSWMKALERETLLDAVAVQDLLLGPMSGCDTVPWRGDIYNIARTLADSSVSGPDILLSFIHSPLLYWNCSIAAIESDSSILTTINNRAHQISPTNITLRPSSVLARILLSHNRLVAADALVVSLFYKAESRAGDLWDKRAEVLAQHDKSRWNVYPAGGRGTGSRFFKFQSRPISVQDKAIFFGAYSLVLVYVIFGLRNLRTLKSRVGLFIAFAIQGCFSILSGFTIAAFLRIDVSNIPPEAYPFIVLVVGLENMFRLVNEVEKTPLREQSVPRIATALGAVGHLSLITVAQNLAILWFLSRVASPGLAAFCGFAAISLTIDLAFFFTFFIAILSVDLRKYGLQDSFEEVRQLREAESTKTAPSNGLAQHQRGDVTRRLRHAALRLLGTVVISLFLFMLSWHFLEGKTIFHWARKFAVLSDRNEFNTGRDQHGYNTILEQTRDLVDWLKMQDRETIREILYAAAPRSYILLARVYDPLVVVLKSADRNPSPAEEILTSPPITTIISGLLLPFLVLFCCVLTLALSLWNCFSIDTSDETRNGTLKSETLSSIQCLPRGHSLDVFRLATSTKRFLTSVGFDHEIRVWNLGSQIIRSQLVPASQQHKLWPVAAISINGKAEWLAICSNSGEISFWNTRLQHFGRSTTINLDTHIVACFFTSSPHYDGVHPATRLLLIHATGRLTDIDVETANVMSHQICADRVKSSYVNPHQRIPLRLITITEDNRIYVTARREGCWISQAFNFSVPILSQPSRLRFTIIPDLKMVALVLNVDTCKLYLIDLVSGATIYTFQPRPFNNETLRAIHSPPQQCLYCGAVALISFSIAYTEEQDGSFTMVTLSAEKNPRLRTGLICLRAERDIRERRCIGFKSGTEKTYSMQHAGVWEITRANGVAGVRPKGKDQQRISKSSTRNSILVRRKAESTRKDQKVDEAWEAWTMTATGVINTHVLTSGLFTSRVGPVCSVGRNAIAVGLAEDIVLIQFGNQLHDDDDNDDRAVRKPPRTKLAGRTRNG